jgi:ribosomal protein S18 acetylase RimI-like enzyme
MSEPVIRLARPGDEAALVAFNRAMALETEGLELDPEVLGRGVRRLLASPELGFYVVVELDGAVGAGLMVTTEWSDWRDATFWWIQSVYVRPELRRWGLYRRLYAFVRERAREAGNVCGFRLYVERENAVAQRTYEALGMRETRYRMYEQAPDAAR